MKKRRRNYSSIAVVLLLCMALLLVSCGQRTANDENTAGNGTQSQESGDGGGGDSESEIGTQELTGSSVVTESGKAMDEAMRKAYASFAYRLFGTCAEGEKSSCLVSPFSVYAALGMLANGAAGETAAQIDAVLGLTEAERNAYFAGWANRLAKTEETVFTCADSVWVANRMRQFVPKDFLAACAGFYGAEMYATDMNNATVRAVNDWVNLHTKQMIPKIIEENELDPGTSIILINAISLDAKWELPFCTDRIQKDTPFTHEDGQKENVEMLCGEADQGFLENDFVTGCVKSYKDGGFRYVALLPKEGVTLDQAVASLTPDSFDALLAGASDGDVNLYIPKYTVKFRKKLNDDLKSLGMKDAFGSRADFSRMLTCGGASVDEVIHETYLSLDNEGTKAAAVTYISIKNTSIRMTHTVRLDRPFLYMIIDENNLPIFLGTYR